MSARRSWDVRREVRAPDAPQPAARKRESLKERRRKQRRVFLIILAILAALVLVAVVYLLWQPFVRIASVSAEGPNAEDAKVIAERALEGTYLYALPKDSIFIFPEGAIRREILSTYPAVTAVSISRTGFTSIAVKNVSRTSAFMWCGESASSSTSCYQADAEGFVFAESGLAAAAKVADLMSAETAPEGVAEAAPAVEDIDMSVLRVYAPLEETEGGSSPVRAHVVGAARLPDALRFVKAVKSLGVGVVSVEIRDDEADLYTPEGTRITYILGREQQAAELAASSFPTLHIGNGGLEYVDLRFDGKVYVKRWGESAAL